MVRALVLCAGPAAVLVLVELPSVSAAAKAAVAGSRRSMPGLMVMLFWYIVRWWWTLSSSVMLSPASLTASSMWSRSATPDGVSLLPANMPRKAADSAGEYSEPPSDSLEPPRREDQRVFGSGSSGRSAES